MIIIQCPNAQEEICDLRNQEGADRFRAEVERLRNGITSKFADMAKANESGNGIMG